MGMDRMGIGGGSGRGWQKREKRIEGAREL
jgi:hypothetical protein